jgi:hypothetical protein
MSAATFKEWRLARRPVGMPVPEDFQLAHSTLRAPEAGEVQVRNTWLSVDPYMRGRMIDRESYVPPFALGEVMQGGAVGVVTASDHPAFAPGDRVSSMMGWREAFTARPEAAMMVKLPALPIPDQAYLGVAGMPGLTAYAGLLRLGQPKVGETVFVSGAAGAVGAIVVQIAKAKGCRVVASAGGAQKCEWLRQHGADAVIDYKTVENGAAGLTRALRSAAPEGIDIYFDNVGGDHLVAALECARVHARLVICGMISAYNATSLLPGPANIIQVIPKRLRIEGFVVTDHFDLQGDFVRDMSQWIASGQMHWQETVREGIEATVSAFLGLFTGENLGKMLVRL